MELLDDKMRIWIESAKFVKPVPGVYVLYSRNKEQFTLVRQIEETLKICRS